ncbi:MAG TPA: ATPase domain-containing protein [Polyangia bacterium]|nr:ATPase domain-containing protein [Polyangia bacterium]
MDRVRTGAPGLDEVLGGGLPRNGIYLVQGSPGVGKTTLALQFLLEGSRTGDKSLYLALTETRGEVQLVADSHGWSLEGLEICELDGRDDQGRREHDQTMFNPAEVELEQTVKPIMEAIRRTRPDRVVIDSLSEIRLLSREPLRYRRQLLSLKDLFLEQECTVLLIDTPAVVGQDSAGILETLIGGLILLEKTTPSYGTTRRRLVVDKLRGVRFSEGYHDMRIKSGGMVVYPRLVAADHPGTASREAVSSDIPELDALFDGGLERGTSTLIMGAAGTGKSSLATQFVMAAARRQERSVVYTFEETFGTWLTRTTGLGFDVKPHLDAGRVRLVHVDPAELAPGELASSVRDAVEHGNARMIVIDSLNGYLQSVPEESFLVLHLHELLTYLAQNGITTIMNIAQHGLLGPAMAAPIDVSYLADSVLFLRYFEAFGEVRQAISIVKKRSGRHEHAIREFQLDQGGVRVGKPLRDFHGVLTGVPTYVGGAERLIAE